MYWSVFVIATQLEKFDPDQVIKVQVDANLSNVVLELYKEDKQILVGSVSGSIQMIVRIHQLDYVNCLLHIVYM